MKLFFIVKLSNSIKKEFSVANPLYEYPLNNRKFTSQFSTAMFFMKEFIEYG